MNKTPPSALSTEQLAQTPLLPHDADGPVFSAPWEAKVFAFVVNLHEQGLFTWPDWCELLAAQIEQAQVAGDPDKGDTYYLHWLSALEAMVARKGAASTTQLAEAFADWQYADKQRAHGEAPVYRKGAGAR